MPILRKWPSTMPVTQARCADCLPAAPNCGLSPSRSCLQLTTGAAALPTDSRMARGHAILLATCSALLSGFLGLPAHADSKSAAEFTLKTCSDAMDDFAKVEAAARDGSRSSKR